ncbi:hypothetical protein CEXT_470401 [Caerostris extrusa]|uniref:Uncharacterized protein n=1 Tax=Caerostris extrusa TaxID=172846 RepID=A0AAV4XVP1_CAEEX|nr:hypothetical protein CEXT_470401 [Caerostris extrusa]
MLVTFGLNSLKEKIKTSGGDYPRARPLVTVHQGARCATKALHQVTMFTDYSAKWRSSWSELVKRKERGNDQGKSNP